MAFDIEEQLNRVASFKTIDGLLTQLAEDGLGVEKSIILVRRRFDVTLNDAYVSMLSNSHWAILIADRMKSDLSFERTIKAFCERNRLSIPQ